MPLYLEAFTCSACGRVSRQVGDGSAQADLCGECSDRLTADAARAEATAWSRRPHC